MSRPLRLDHAGAIWHITCRGNEKREIFRDADDRRELLRVVDHVVDVCRWRIHAYVLMGNHYHLLLETPEANLSGGMRQLNGIYTQRFNRRHDRIGHLFQGRFTSILIEKDPHLLELIRYVVLNPVRAGLVAKPEGWHWSNFRATAALVRPPRWLEIGWTLSQFGGGAFACDRYRQFVHAGLDKSGAPWVNLKKQVFLGGDEFRRRTQERIDRGSRSDEVPWAQRHCVRPTFEAIVLAVGSEFGVPPALLLQRRRSPVRLAAAYLARHDGGLALRDFAAALGVKRWSASRLASQAERLVAKSSVFRRRIDRIRSVLKQTHTLRDLTP
jgi:putative transposase